MIRITPPGTKLVQRLRARAGRIAAAHADTVRRDARNRRTDWRSATDLWPDFFGKD